ncbi:protein of unknown function DUF1657 [Caldalkalibacillus thermarum TA2.A1]|uniref:DUF1657 domain-containing protein n=1 Tax=Caldalkalibacillus thermarum (strain TA2.A1) TaxID=986075 RepID=F5L8T1_CALTT|nr:DUF1657 domain-containing protein [Caldalkalibacillus thermarum]EGL82213.1 protein of unknown function DUF1657 [Caldalkalibacillus thermarum TA2.A1]QZT32769.1 DUF1657 domain-containing protein [Caldalkalibacillus thermarum TA2.A1]
MTVASKLKQTIASLKGAQATMETYATHHPDQRVKETFKICGQQVEQIIAQLDQRLKEMEFEEPQYRGF